MQIADCLIICLDDTRGVGPIAVKREFQNGGVGKKLMISSIEKALKEGAKRITLMQVRINAE